MQPFLALIPKNTSWLIASTLPALLPATSASPTPIHIHVHHAAIRVAYHTVTSLIPAILPPNSPMYPKPDIVLHIGLAAGRQFYTFEKGAHRRGYGAIPDVDEERFEDGDAEKRWPNNLYPEKLETGFEVNDVLERWKSFLGYASSSRINGYIEDAAKNPSDYIQTEDSIQVPDVRISEDAGNYMCGFIYYNSLAHYYNLDASHVPVAFLHVPDLSKSTEEVNIGSQVAVALIKALVESRRMRGVHGHMGEVEEKENSMASMDVNFTG